jgi:uncharacterized protein (DUF58 family)
MTAMPMRLDERTRNALRRLEWQLRHRVRSSLVGSYRSIFRGRGMEFEQVVKYTFGDDIRDVDWNVTARLGEPFRKVFVEDRELTVYVVVEDRPNLQFGSGDRSKREALLELAALTMLVAAANRERVGFVHFRSGDIARLEPTRQRSQVMRSIAELLSSRAPDPWHEPVAEPWAHLMRVAPPGSLIMWFGDVDETAPTPAWSALRSRHELIGIRADDKWERNGPDVGGFTAYDPEARQVVWVADSPAMRVHHSEWRQKREECWQAWWPHPSNRLVVDVEADPLAALVSFLRRRSRRRPGVAA